MLSSTDYHELLQLRRDFEVLYAEWKQILLIYSFRKFSPHQPRKPPGPGGGQWTSEGGTAALTREPSKIIATVGQSAAYCWNQMLVDMLLCGSLRPAWHRAACRAQANERYSACLSGRPMPPLPF